FDHPKAESYQRCLHGAHSSGYLESKKADLFADTENVTN
ncbi:MAG: hypothetical protein PWQ43_1562, partial [Rikenellaceae bacterium]|nr:hypothetical protein [Rikenellaceae bacterium]